MILLYKKNSKELVKGIWLLVLMFRILNACLCVSHCYYDETFQSVEISHYISFGTGLLSNEWIPQTDVYGIRAAYHPLLYVPVYYLLKLFHLDKNRFLFLNLPKALNGVFAAIMDYSIYRYTLLRFESSDTRKYLIANMSLLCSLLCVANGHFGIRFFSNTFETVLTSIGMWMWGEFEKRVRDFEKEEQKSDKKNEIKIIWPLIFLTVIIFFAFFLRSSNGVIWLG
jgi:phosphatidylinositol glycan class B